jgi:hypothetical protein
MKSYSHKNGQQVAVTHSKLHTWRYILPIDIHQELYARNPDKLNPSLSQHDEMSLTPCLQLLLGPSKARRKVTFYGQMVIENIQLFAYSAIFMA